MKEVVSQQQSVYTRQPTVSYEARSENRSTQDFLLFLRSLKRRSVASVMVIGERLDAHFAIHEVAASFSLFLQIC